MAAFLFFFARGCGGDEPTGGGTETSTAPTTGPVGSATSPSTAGTTPATEATTAADFPNPDEEALLARVPGDFRATCSRWEQALEEEGALAAVRCAPASGADTAAYIQYASLVAMYADYDSDLDDVGVERDSGSCADADNVESSYDRDGATAGRVYCQNSEGRSVIGWTHDASNVLSLGVRSDESTRELFEWWTSAGPSD